GCSRFARTFVTRTARPVAAPSASARRATWPPPSPRAPSMRITGARARRRRKGLSASALAQDDACAGLILLTTFLPAHDIPCEPRASPPGHPAGRHGPAAHGGGPRHRLRQRAHQRRGRAWVGWLPWLDEAQLRL